MEPQPEDDPKQMIERLDRLVEETASRNGETIPTDNIDPVARKHREAVRRGAGDDSGDGNNTDE